MNKLRWGILGAARIAWKNWKAIYHSGNSTLTAVASRDPAKAGEFVRGCQQLFPFDPPPRVAASYEELLASADVDAVYLPLPTALRKEWVIRAARAGKHVLSEKPGAVNAADLREMLDVCREQRVQFMDGVMFAHSHRLPALRATLDDAANFGDIRRINSNFSFLGTEGFLQSNIRAHGALEPLGCLGDLGWYCVRFSLWVMNGRMPSQATGRILQSHDGGAGGVPIEFSGELVFPGGATAGFYCSFVAGHEQLAHIIGTRACVELPDFVLPFTNEDVTFNVRRYATPTAGTEWKIEPTVKRVAIGEHGGDPGTAQETNMIRNFAAQVHAGGLNESWPESALQTQLVVDACLESARVEQASRQSPV